MITLLFIKTYDMKKKTTLLLVALLCVSSLGSQAQNLEKAKEIIQKANDVALKTTAISYYYTYEGYGKYTGHFNGKVKLQGNYPTFSTYIVLNALDDEGELIKTDEIASANMDIQMIDHRTKEYKYGSLTGGSSHLSSYSYYAALYQYISPQPFASELKDPTLKYEGLETVNGRQCYVVSTLTSFSDRLYWYIGKDDFIIHANKSEHDDPDEGGGFYFELNNLVVDETLPADQMLINVPDGYEKIDEDNREIKVGIEAPGWFLKNLKGESRRKLDYQGQVVVLDFWASWCKPCWKIMPMINSIQQAYDEKEVKVFGINVWEKKGLDLQSYLKKKGLDHYETLIDKDVLTANKYKIFALPLVVVIGKDGLIKYISNSGTKDLEMELKEAVESAVKE